MSHVKAVLITILMAVLLAVSMAMVFLSQGEQIAKDGEPWKGFRGIYKKNWGFPKNEGERRSHAVLRRGSPLLDTIETLLILKSALNPHHHWV